MFGYLPQIDNAAARRTRCCLSLRWPTPSAPSRHGLRFTLHRDNPARIKQVWDIVQIGDGKFLSNIKKGLNELHFGYGVPTNQIKIAAALHGPPNMLNCDDYVSGASTRLANGSRLSIPPRINLCSKYFIQQAERCSEGVGLQRS
ncbi:MAG: hypothetical protein JWQ49_2238 [Edaphobacter sp.]|nr:hypothetical protein [Edaphobacter sp.]